MEYFQTSKITITWFINWVGYLRTHDLPNWIAVSFTGIIWPLTLYIWRKRSITGIRNLQIFPDTADGTIQTGENCTFLKLKIENNTGMRIYIADMSMRITKRIKANPNAEKDISTKGYTLKFAEKGESTYSRTHITLDTAQEVTTALPLANDYNLKNLITELKDYSKNLIVARYFILNFDCMAGTAHYRVKFKY